MDNNEKIRQIEPITIIFIFFQLVFVIILGVTINSIFNQKAETAKINIDNYSTISKNDGNYSVDVGNGAELNDSQKSAVEGVLYNIAALNNLGNIPNYRAKIRDGSVYNAYIKDLDIYLLNFIVDLEELGQSYRIVYRWTDHYPNKNAPADEPVVAFCLRSEELIYGNFDCKDDYNEYGEDFIVYSLLKNKNFDGNFFISLFGDVSNGGTLEKIYISPIVNNEETRAEAENTLREWLANLGFDLDNFNYEFSDYDWV